ncbi:unnamed protein product, partial [Allacma fusca]
MEHANCVCGTTAEPPERKLALISQKQVFDS